MSLVASHIPADLNVCGHRPSFGHCRHLWPSPGGWKPRLRLLSTSAPSLPEPPPTAPRPLSWVKASSNESTACSGGRSSISVCNLSPLPRTANRLCDTACFSPLKAPEPAHTPDVAIQRLSSLASISLDHTSL